MMASGKYIKSFFLWLALAIFIGHSVVPHVHHDGDEPWHLKKHFASHDTHKSLVVHFHHHENKKDENACHFNPNPLPVAKDQLKTFFLNSTSVSIQLALKSEKIFVQKDLSKLPDTYHKVIFPRGPPAFYC